jgi:hypothetical protein
VREDSGGTVGIVIFFFLRLHSRNRLPSKIPQNFGNARSHVSMSIGIYEFFVGLRSTHQQNDTLYVVIT